MLLGRLLPLGVLIWTALPIVPRDLPFDTERTYLPLARLLLLDPAGFWRDPLSLAVGPGTYVAMALLGAREDLLRWTAVGLAAMSLLLLADAARRAAEAWWGDAAHGAAQSPAFAGWVAGAAAAWLYALSPLVAGFALWLQSETFFMAGVAAWLWAMAWLLTAPPEAPRGRVAGAVALGGALLAATTLTRGTYQFWIPVAALGGMAAAWRGRGRWRWLGARVAAVHLIALALVGMVAVRHAVVFDRPIIAVGVGQALYMGSNPMLGGYEPPWFGLLYDDAAVTGGPFQQLTVDGDRRLMRVARAMLADTPPRKLARLYVRKAGALLFLSKAHLTPGPWNARAWRVLLVLLAAWGAWRLRRQAFVLFLTLVALYQWGVHVPVLYNPRYATGALEVPLILLAALGAAALLAGAAGRGRRVVAAAVIVGVGVAAGAWHQRAARPVLPALERGPHRLLARAKPGDLEVRGFEGSPWRAGAVTASSGAQLRWPDVDLSEGRWAVMQLAVRELDPRCSALNAHFESATGERTQMRVDLRGRRAGDAVTFGVAPLVLPIAGQHGLLRIEWQCPPGARVHLEGLSLHQASPGLHYGPRVLGAAAAKTR